MDKQAIASVREEIEKKIVECRKQKEKAFKRKDKELKNFYKEKLWIYSSFLAQL